MTEGVQCFSAHTCDVFVVSGDVLVSGITNSFGADEGSDPLRVFTVAHYPALAHHNGVNVSVHRRVYKGDVKKQVCAAVLDGSDRSRAAAEDPCNQMEIKEKKGREGLVKFNLQRKDILEPDGQDESRTSAPLLGGRVQDLPAIHFGSQVVTFHPALYPHMEVPVIDGGG